MAETDTNYPQHQEYFLQPGYIYVPRTPTLISTVLGSCVAVCIWDRKKEYGGMNHFLYPSTLDSAKSTAQYGNVSTKALVQFFLDDGCNPKNLEAQIFGGAFLPDGPERSAEVSRENVNVARTMLQKSKVHIVSEDVGGSKGRKLVYNSLSNEVLIIRVDTIRKSDWYPYEGKRR